MDIVGPSSVYVLEKSGQTNMFEVFDPRGRYQQTTVLDKDDHNDATWPGLSPVDVYSWQQTHQKRLAVGRHMGFLGLLIEAGMARLGLLVHCHVQCFPQCAE